MLPAQLLAKQALPVLGAQLQLLFQRPPQTPQAAAWSPAWAQSCGLCFSLGVHEWEGAIHGAA